MTPAELKTFIRRTALALGFDDVGVARAQPMDEERDRLRAWLDRGLHGSMAYMANHFDKRLDPTLLVPGAKSVISFVHNYFPAERQPRDTYQVATYAYGRDYHKVLKKKLKKILHAVAGVQGPVQGRIFTDSAPVMERQWAARAGLGWQGKHTLLIHPRRGSYFFLAEWICDLELPPDEPMSDHCGRCTRCIDACPTGAIAPEGYLLDASKCISYATIEHKGPLPDSVSGRLKDWVFGCDICQEVCPWNRFATPHSEPEFTPHPHLLTLSRRGWEEMTEEVFEEIFFGTPVKRAGYEGIRRNVKGAIIN